RAAAELPRRAVHARLEARVAAAAAAALRDEQGVAVVREIAEQLLGVDVADLGPFRDLDVEIGARGTRHVLARTAAAVLGLEAPLHAEVRKRVDAFARDEINTATVAAVAAVRAAARNELLAPEAHATVAAAAGLDIDVRFVDEFHGVNPNKKAPPKRGFREPCGALRAGRPRQALSDDADQAAVPRPFDGERDPTGGRREQRMVAADADVDARVILRAALAHDDVAGNDLLAAEALDAQALRL